MAADDSHRTFDVAIIGGGIVGTSAAAFLAEAGVSVVLFERHQIAAGASGRNSGTIQHPFDRLLAPLHARSLELYRQLDAGEHGFRIQPQPAGLLLLSPDREAVVRAASGVDTRAPELGPQVLTAAELRRLEPTLAGGLAACRLETGYPVEPSAATLAFARRASLAGAELRVGQVARPSLDGASVRGVRLAGGVEVSAPRVLVAAGPWSPLLLSGWSTAPPIRSVWGVVAGVTLPVAPRHVLEELGIDEPGHFPAALFSMVTAGGKTSVGSTFLTDEPVATEVVGGLLDRAARFVPSLAGIRVDALRACARPAAFDGRPIIGRLPGTDGLFVCAGHGPWGISTGPASAEMVCDQIMAGLGPAGPGSSPAPELGPERLIGRLA